MFLKNSGSHTMPRNNNNELFHMPHSLMAERQFSVSVETSDANGKQYLPRRTVA